MVNEFAIVCCHGPIKPLAKASTLRLYLQHAVLHYNLIVDFHKRALTLIPESCFAIAVARARARDHVRQTQITARETDINELVLRFEPSHHGLSIRAAKAEPFLLGSMIRLGAAQH